MTSRNIIPFNQQPASVDDKTTSYTVPAGQYARVTFMTTDCTYDSKNVFRSESLSISLGSPETMYLTFLHPFDKISMTRDSGSQTVTTSAVQLHWGAATASEATIGAGLTSFGYFGTDLDDVDMAVATISAPEHRQLKVLSSGVSTTWTTVITRFTGFVTMWVPTGTALAGSLYHVELYNEIT